MNGGPRELESAYLAGWLYGYTHRPGREYPLADWDITMLKRCSKFLADLGDVKVDDTQEGDKHD